MTKQQPCPSCRATLVISPGQESVTCDSCGATFRMKRVRLRGTPEPPPEPEPPPIVVTADPPAPHGMAPAAYSPPKEPVPPRPQRYPPLTPPTGPVPDPQQTLPVTIDEPVNTGIWLGLGLMLAPVIVAGTLLVIFILLSIFAAAISTLGNA